MVNDDEYIYIDIKGKQRLCMENISVRGNFFFPTRYLIMNNYKKIYGS